MSAASDSITIALGSAPAVDAFGLDIAIDGLGALETLVAAGPGLFRPLPRAHDGLCPAGWIVGFLQRGPLLTPITMPRDGWVLASAPDGSRVEHGTPVLRILARHEKVLP